MSRKGFDKGNPGSLQAALAGCKCPVMDNGYGLGSGMNDDNGKPVFWISDRCPIHGEGEEL